MKIDLTAEKAMEQTISLYKTVLQNNKEEILKQSLQQRMEELDYSISKQQMQRMISKIRYNHVSKIGKTIIKNSDNIANKLTK